jgi:uncharacterized LabA/DUF88 family protein
VKKTAILIDGGWFNKVLRAELTVLIPGGPPKKPAITAAVIRKNALLALDPKEEEPFRIFYYDAFPYDRKVTNPVDGKAVDFGSSGTFAYTTKLFDEVGQMDLVALRRGLLKPRGWTLTDTYVKNAIAATQGAPPKAPPILGSTDVFFSLEQKGVDMRIGIDVATLAIKRQVERILLLSGDTDMIPAMKLARREGVQVIVVQVGGTRISKELIEDSDFLRRIKPTL